MDPGKALRDLLSLARQAFRRGKWKEIVLVIEHTEIEINLSDVVFFVVVKWTAGFRKENEDTPNG